MKLYYNHKLIEYAKENRKSMTLGEKAFWCIVKRKQFMGYDFHRQKPIGEYIADFYCHELKLVVEIDGATHENEKEIYNDRMKDDYYKSLGLKVLRFEDLEVIGNANLIEKKLKEIIFNDREID